MSHAVVVVEMGEVSNVEEEKKEEVSGDHVEEEKNEEMSDDHVEKEKNEELSDDQVLVNHTHC